MKRSRILLAAIALCATSLAARADTATFNFTFGTSTDVFSGSGTFTAMSTATAGEYQVTGVTGTVFTTANSNDPKMIAMLLDPGTFPTLTNGGSTPANDNLLFYPTVNGGYYDFNGVAFALGNGAQINLYYQLGGPNDVAVLRSGGSSLKYENVTQTVTQVNTAATPEPGSIVLLGSGLLSVVGLLRRRKAV